MAMLARFLLSLSAHFCRNADVVLKSSVDGIILRWMPPSPIQMALSQTGLGVFDLDLVGGEPMDEVLDGGTGSFGEGDGSGL